MKKFITLFLITSFWVSISFSQDRFTDNPKQMLSKPGMKHQGATIDLSTYQSPKKLGHYTKEEWRALIDSLWGPGPPTSTKLQIFDSFWNNIDRYYGGFPHLTVNWDSMKALYRPEVEAGVSRGRFWAIMGQLYLPLQEIHTWIYDIGLDSMYLENGKIVYRPGLPVFFPSGWGWAGNFGAALTPLPDSSLLVYRTITPHPLDIVPGDIVLGYDSIPWKKLYKDLLSVELPLEWWHETRYGSSSRSMTHALLNSAGTNWGLFDTVDVVKYSTGDTLHLPTAPLTGLDWYSLFATEQVTVPGVEMPNYASGENVTWGVVENTTVGYVYVYSWDAAVSSKFAVAIQDLVISKNVSGLILDFRYNRGSVDSWTSANGGLDYLYNEDPAGSSRWKIASRSDPTNHYSFGYSGPPATFSPRPDYYDRPIAILTGPQAWSLGDHTSFRMRFHPMVRFFGLPTNGAYAYNDNSAGPVWGTWYYMYITGQMYSLVNNESFLMHKCFPVDEEIWLTKDDVAKGEDTVVKRAIEWINNLSHAHNTVVDRTYIRPNQDTVIISATVENPNQHLITVLATLTNDSNTVLDSLYLFDDGLHNDGQAGDKIWAVPYFYNSSIEQNVHVTITTNDPIAGDIRCLSNAVQFTSIGPLVFAGRRNISVDQEINAGDVLRFKFTVRNESSTGTAINISSNVVPLDTCASIPSSSICSYGDLSPGASFEGGSSQYIRFNKNCAGQTAHFALEIYSNYYHFWSDTFSIDIVSGIEQGEQIAVKEFNLKQNYPNPFNPNTTIEFSLPKTEWITLQIFNILGQQVATLISEKLNPGVYKRDWIASDLPSGVYYYRLRAGDFVQTKKLILLR